MKWLPAALLVYAQAGYLALLAAWARAERPAVARRARGRDAPPPVTLVIAAHDEEAVIAAKVATRSRSTTRATGSR